MLVQCINLEIWWVSLPKPASKFTSILDVLGWFVLSSLWKAADTDPVGHSCSVTSLLRVVSHSKHSSWTTMKTCVVICYRLAMGSASWWWNSFLLRQKIWRYHLILVTQALIGQWCWRVWCPTTHVGTVHVSTVARVLWRGMILGTKLLLTGANTCAGLSCFSCHYHNIQGVTGGKDQTSGGCSLC